MNNPENDRSKNNHRRQVVASMGIGVALGIILGAALGNIGLGLATGAKQANRGWNTSINMGSAGWHAGMKTNGNPPCSKVGSNSSRPSGNSFCKDCPHNEYLSSEEKI